MDVASPRVLKGSSGRSSAATPETAGTLRLAWCLRMSHGKKIYLTAVVAATFAAAALVVRRNTLRAERLYPAKGKFVEADGVRLHYANSGGEGPAVVLLHGNGTSASDWEISGVFCKAGTKYRVIAFDRPGFGHSGCPRGRCWSADAQADLIKGAIQAIGIANPIVAGHSWGALVAAALAIRHPQFVKGLVVASGPYFPEFRPSLFVSSQPAIPILGDALRYTIFPLIGRAIAPWVTRRVFAPQAIPAGFKRCFPMELALRPSQIRATAMESILTVLAAAELQRLYSAIRVPAVIIAGTDDKIVDTEKQSMRLYHLIPRSRLRLLSGIGHMVHYFASDAFVEAIDSLASDDFGLVNPGGH
ncbi:MAG TPA: alpha/beta hydrolase, partial [Hyphomicrobiales bacterium]|nr:alpha/beta hydrolase [Hyphomicrobiales bacterium]